MQFRHRANPSLCLCTVIPYLCIYVYKCRTHTCMSSVHASKIPYRYFTSRSHIYLQNELIYFRPTRFWCGCWELHIGIHTYIHTHIHSCTHTFSMNSSISGQRDSGVGAENSILAFSVPHPLILNRLLELFRARSGIVITIMFSCGYACMGFF